MNNPIAKAIKAAYAELSTPEAIQWYKATAYQTYLVIATLATLAYLLVEQWLLTSEEEPLLAPPSVDPLAFLLAPVTVPALVQGVANTASHNLPLGKPIPRWLT
jgi:hypothetical protein